MAALADPHAALHQERARLVDQPCAAVDQARADPVQSLKVELLGRLYADKAHRRPGRGFGDGFCIPVVRLVNLDIGLHIKRRHQTHFVSKAPTVPRDRMRPATGLHGNRARLQSGQE